MVRKNHAKKGKKCYCIEVVTPVPQKSKDIKKEHIIAGSTHI